MKNENIYTKLLAFQKQNISVLKDGNNPHFKSKYATLNEVLDKVKKPLNDLGVVIIFEPNIEGLQTILHCTESNTEVKGFMKYVDCGNAQKLLACNTYYRRGTLVSLLGLEDEDDDGNKASGKTEQPKPEVVKPKQKVNLLATKIDTVNKALAEGTTTKEFLEANYFISQPVMDLLIFPKTK